MCVCLYEVCLLFQCATKSKKMSLRREDKGKTPVDKPRRNRSRYIIEEVPDTANLISMPQSSQHLHRPLMNPTPPLIHPTLPHMHPTPPSMRLTPPSMHPTLPHMHLTPPSMCPTPPSMHPSSSTFTYLLSTPYSTFHDISPSAFLSPPGHTSYMPHDGPSTSIPTIDPAFTHYRDPGGGFSTSHSSPMHSPHEEQGDDDDHAEQVVQDEADQEHRNACILRNVPQVIRKRNKRFVIQPEGSS
ncbi:hypothetical protein RYX36_001737 [Vicia faba]